MQAVFGNATSIDPGPLDVPLLATTAMPGALGPLAHEHAAAPEIVTEIASTRKSNTSTIT